MVNTNVNDHQDGLPLVDNLSRRIPNNDNTGNMSSMKDMVPRGHIWEQTQPTAEVDTEGESPHNKQQVKRFVVKVQKRKQQCSDVSKLQV